MMKRIEVWFKDGLFRAFPNVQNDTVDKSNGIICFKFGNDHEAVIYESSVNFIEIMDIQDISEAHN